MDTAAALVGPVNVFDPDVSASAFKERERRITEQVKRQVRNDQHWVFNRSMGIDRDVNNRFFC